MIIGITGSVGSGKSTIARLFSKKGYKVIDADRMGHAVLRMPSVKRKIRRVFGKEIFSGKEVARKKLGRIVFSDKKKLRELNQIVHPEIGKQIKKALKGKKDVVLDAAVLLEAGWQAHVDKVIVVKTSRQKQTQRLLKQKRYPRAIINKIISSQMPLKKKMNYADFVVDNSGSLERTEEQVKDILQELRK